MRGIIENINLNSNKLYINLNIKKTMNKYYDELCAEILLEEEIKYDNEEVQEQYLEHLWD